jgi:hypothetical protein
MTGNGNHTTYKNGDDWGMVYDCFSHIHHPFSWEWFRNPTYRKNGDDWGLIK